MSEVDRFAMLLLRVGVSFPRGVLGDEAREFAIAIADGASPADLIDLRQATADAHWESLRLAMGAALGRAGSVEGDPTLGDALALTSDSDPGNPLALGFAEDAGRLLAATILRTRERVEVLERRLSGDGAGEDAALVLGAVVVDLLDLDPEDFEDEIAAYVGGADTDEARDELARSSGDPEVRQWARDELRWASTVAGSDTTPLAVLASGELPEDAAADPVWVATILALVEEALEIATVNQDDPEGSGNGAALGDV